MKNIIKTGGKHVASIKFLPNGKVTIALTTKEKAHVFSDNMVEWFQESIAPHFLNNSFSVETINT